MKKYNKFQSGLYGLLIGDALGVPYEFHSAAEIPPYSDIEMTPPLGFERAHRRVEPGTWSDDGAQALCLLDSIITCGKFDLKDFSDKLLCWYQEGKWAVDGMVFDIGIQTSEALMAYKSGMVPEKCGMVRPDGKGNGALMRTLPLALWHNGTDKELVIDAHSQCLITHGNICNQVCCALYCLVARSLLNDLDFDQALENGVQVLRNIYREMPEYEQELEWSVRPDEPWEGSGSGYVVDCLRSAFMIMKRATSYEEAVKQAIMLGDDTDTTACVTGGLAGILFGFENIPSRWYNALRGKEEVESLVKMCCSYK
ncbi:MAG: ADP-ribosylglycohydrolase family protein [Lachnospiraceae bacterium]|nr:ADP-ribosylglycohydrolase family protein [Lachnospiraceae bacterium]